MFAEVMDGLRGPYKNLICHEFYETNESRGFVRGFSFEMQRGYGPVTTTMRGMFTGKIPLGADHHAAYDTMHGRIVGLIAVCEDLPKIHNRVTLDTVLKDSNSIPALKLSTR